MSREASTNTEQTKGRTPLARVSSAFSFMAELADASGPFDLAPVDAELLRNAVAAWLDQGHAITLGRTSDGGAVGVHLLANGQKRSAYFSSVAELEDFLTRVARSGDAN